MSDIGFVMLAAGGSLRMGSPKQLLPFNGRPLIRHAAEQAIASECQGAIVVLGSRAGEIRETLSDLPLEVVDNPGWVTGIGSSIRAGVSRAQELDWDGLVLALADQPLVSPEVYNRLIFTWRATKKPVIVSQYADTVGVPAFFARSYFSKLLALKATEGCKGLILSSAEDVIRLACKEAETDVDTPQDYEKIQTL